MRSWFAAAAVLVGFALVIVAAFTGSVGVIVWAAFFFGLPLVIVPTDSRPKVSASRTSLERLTDRYVSQEDPDWDQFEREVARLMVKPTRTPWEQGYEEDDERARAVAAERRRAWEIREIQARNRKERGW